MWGKLTKQEQALLYKSIDEIKHQNYYEYQLFNGNYLIDINNKIIISNGNYQSPSINGIVEFNKFSNKISEARDYFYEGINYGRSIWEIIENINSLCEEDKFNDWVKLKSRITSSKQPRQK